MRSSLRSFPVPWSYVTHSSLLLSVVLLFALPLSAVSSGDPELDSSGPLFSMSNPAAFYCQELGYDHVVERTADGEVGICILPDGRRVNAWDFFRGKVGAEYGYCERLGLTTAMREPADGDYGGACAACLDEAGAEVGTVWELMELGEKMSPLVPVKEPDLMWAPAADDGRARRTRELPAAFDWFELGGVTSVKNQGGCGSCWAFSAVAAFESDIKVKDGIAVDLSEQWLVSCNSDGWSCSGGRYAHRYHQWKPDPCGDAGAPLESEFPYGAQNLPCECPYEHAYMLDGWGHVSGEEGIPTTDEMKQAILDHGPIEAAVFIDENFSAYTGGIFRQCEYQWAPNHTVLIVGWDDNIGTEGAWRLKNSWGPFWGEDGYMRIEYGCNYIGFGACWTSYREPLRISFPDGTPAYLVPEEDTSLLVHVEELTDTFVPGSGELHYRYNGGDFDSVPLVPQGGGLFEAVLPPADCFHSPQFYVSVDGERYGAVTSPTRAPDELYESAVGYRMVKVYYDFEAQQGWTVNDDPDLIDGSWERGVPVGGGLRGDPPTDYDGSGSCFVTANEAGNSDVDGGYTRLLTPLLQFDAATDVVVQYALWYTNDRGNNPNQDIFKIRYLNNPGWLTPLHEVGPMTPTPTDWHVGTLAIGDIVDHQNGFWLSFEAWDTSPWSVVEAGLDAVTVTALKCDPTGVGEDVAVEPRLHGASPNPFADETRIRLELPGGTSAVVTIYDAAGREVRRLAASATGAGGPRSIVWDGRDDAGRKLASGVYFCRLEADGEFVERKMILLR